MKREKGETALLQQSRVSFRKPRGDFAVCELKIPQERSVVLTTEDALGEHMPWMLFGLPSAVNMCRSRSTSNVIKEVGQRETEA